MLLTQCQITVMLSRVVKWEGPPGPHAVCCGMGYVLMETAAVHDKGKGPWNSYPLHKYNISGSGTIFLHILFRQILPSPFYARGNWDPGRLRDLPGVSQLLRWRRQDWLEYRTGYLRSLFVLSDHLCAAFCGGSDLWTQWEILDDKCIWFT